MWSLLLSTVAFFAAAYWIKRYLDEQDINHGMTRNIVVFVFATVVSLVVSAVVDKFEDHPVDQTAQIKNVVKLLAQ
jgi:uncharacterized membrane protein